MQSYSYIKQTVIGQLGLGNRKEDADIYVKAFYFYA
jgi:hypothetical protein